MPCPSCGGNSRKPIAPGYWECMTVIDDPAIVKSAWDVADPWRAATFPKRPCGHRYREGPSVPSEPCRCGIYSIGRCGRCNDPFCGNHGHIYEGTFHCNGCARELFQADQERKHEVEEKEKREAKSVRDKLERSFSEAVRRAVKAMEKSGHPPERLVVMGQIQTPGTGGPGGGRPGKQWLEIVKEMGLGWYLGRFVWAASEDGEAMSARLVLAGNGRLLEGSGLFGRWDKAEDGFHLRVRPGWFFPSLKKPVLAVKTDEFEIARCGDKSIKDLTAGLLEIAAGESSVSRWNCGPDNPSAGIL